MRFVSVLTVLTAGALLPLSAQADVVLVNEPFTDGDLTGGADASGIAWYGQDAQASLNIQTRFDGNALVFSANSNNRSASGLFDGVTLGQVGDFIEVTLQIEFDADFPDQRDGFRIGLGNSGGTPANGSDTSLLDDDTGFEATLNPVGGANDGVFNEVHGSFNLGGRYDVAAAGTDVHNLTLRLERIAGETDDQMRITFSGDLIDETGNTVTAVKSDPNTFTFDQVVFSFAGGGVRGPVWIDNVTVTSNVPEPGSMALLSLGGALVLARRRG